jgi:hypothetical protein
MTGSATVADTIFPPGRRKTSAEYQIPYSKTALRHDLTRVRNAWEDCQASRDRNAIYGYLSAVFDLVMWWAAEGRAIDRARKAPRLQNIWPSDHNEPFAAIILATADPKKVDRRTRSKWSRGTRWSTRQLLNRLPRLFSGRAVSTHVRRDLPDASGDTVETEARNSSWR